MSAYDHRHHVGNGGDVWKHVAWTALLATTKRDRVSVLDTHAGGGTYHLGNDGEWLAGIGKLQARWPDAGTGSGAVDRYLARVAKWPRGQYPGSPALARHALGKADRLVCYEVDPGAAGSLRRSLEPHPGLRVVEASGWEAPELTAREPWVVHVDPPYSDKEDWARAAVAVAAAHGAGHQLMLWYPIKRWSRPNLLLQQIRESHVPYVALDLLWTPVELEKKRIVGAGVLLVGVARSVVAELHAAAPVVGEALATVDGRWSLRVTANG
ncbi:MAG: 23S rRNA (adenine(2030)-N(6))-methyltransferase RlmJ [Myxococcota bacterium]